MGHQNNYRRSHKMKQFWFHNAVMLKRAYEMANSVKSAQTAPLGAILRIFAVIFVTAIKIKRFLRYFFVFFYVPTSKKLRGHLGLGPSVCPIGLLFVVKPENCLR